MSNERELIKKITLGDFEAFQEIIEKYQNQLYNLICRMVKNVDDSSDILQEVFLKVYKNLKNYKYQSSFSTWIYRITYNLTVDHIRKSVRSKNETIYRDDLYTSKSENYSELTDLIYDEMKKLNEKESTALFLLYHEDKDYSEISEIMGIPLNTVKSHIFRGKENLKSKLEVYL